MCVLACTIVLEVKMDKAFTACLLGGPSCSTANAGREQPRQKPEKTDANAHAG
jgi:hypothetical protein